MNKSDRTTLAMALRRFNANLTKEIDRFNGIVDTLCAAEGGKIGNLPESLQDSPMAAAITEWQQELEGLAERMEGFNALVEEIASDWDIDLARGKALANVGEPPAIAAHPQERKSHRLFALVTPSTREALSAHARETGLSMNQILNAAIARHLLEGNERLQ
jgi:hypothetical protein